VPQKPLIVCVDDDEAVSDAMKALLEASGFDAETFTSAEAFLQSGRPETASCLITDVKLGGMSGPQLQERLVALGHDIPVIVMTAFPDDRVRARVLAAGAVGLLPKPVTKQELLTCIDSALKRRVVE
jgi:FixJ family two-component response regulator